MMHILHMLSQVSDVTKFPVAPRVMTNVRLILGMAHIVLKILAQTYFDLVAVTKCALEDSGTLLGLLLDEFIHYEVCGVRNKVLHRVFLEHGVHVVFSRDSLDHPSRV